MNNKIKKAKGETESERNLAKLCETTFLKAWSYLNPRQGDKNSKEICDVIAVFENHIFLFFDRNCNDLKNTEKKFEDQWKKWKNKTIDKQIDQACGAKKYIINNLDKIYLDPKKENIFPVSLPKKEDLKFHCIIVANGVEEVCKNYSKENTNGSLAINYSDNSIFDSEMPFFIELDKNEIFHIFDDFNLNIILDELDTFHDFHKYIEAKEKAIKKYATLIYHGEEDLLAHYFCNFDESKQEHYIGLQGEKSDTFVLAEGGWNDFISREEYKRRKEANNISYFWDELIHRTCDNVFEGVALGNTDIFNIGAIYEMAKEPRFMRRGFSKKMIEAIESYPDNLSGKPSRKITFIQSFYEYIGYVFLQTHKPNVNNYEEYRRFRQYMLEVACGVAKNKFPNLKKIVGIAIDAPKFNKSNSEDFILMDCEDWTNELKKEYENLNENIRFFETEDLQKRAMNEKEFPDKI